MRFPSEEEWKKACHRLKVNHSPLQRPGKDTLVREFDVAGPETMLDIRALFSVEQLEFLLARARESLTQRVVITHAGLHGQLWETSDGYRYETWKLTGLTPKPEDGLLK